MRDPQPALEEQQYDVKKTKTRTLLTNKKDAMRTSSKAGVRLEKIPEASLSMGKTGGKGYSVEPMDRNADGGPMRMNSDSQVQGSTQFKNQRITEQE